MKKIEAFYAKRPPVQKKTRDPLLYQVILPKNVAPSDHNEGSSFHEEEWRLIGGLYKEPHEVSSYRFRGSIIAPHREFDLKDSDGIIRSIPEILIEPNPNQLLAEVGLFSPTQQTKIESMTTRRSEIPFRA